MKDKNIIFSSLLEWFDKVQNDVLSGNIAEEVKERLDSFYVSVAYSIFMLQSEPSNDISLIKRMLKEINAWTIPCMERYWSLSNSGVLIFRDVVNVCKITWTDHAREQALKRDPKCLSLLEQVKESVLRKITGLNIPDENQRYFLIVQIFDSERDMVRKTAMIVVLKRTLGRPILTVVTTIGRKRNYFIMKDTVPIELKFLKTSVGAAIKR